MRRENEGACHASTQQPAQRTPSPQRGEGWGEGVRTLQIVLRVPNPLILSFSPSARLRASSTRYGGEGTQRAGCVAFLSSLRERYIMKDVEQKEPRWRTMLHQSVLPHIKPLGLEDRHGGRRGQNLDQRFRRFWFFGARRDAGRVGRDLLQLRRQHADHVHAGIRHQLGHLLQADLGFAARHQDADPPIGSAGGEFYFGCDLSRDAEPLEQLHDMGGRDAAAGRRGVRDGFCRQQGALERFGRRDIRPGRALAHADTDAGARDSGRAGQDFALPDEIVERAAVDDDHVGRLAADETAGDAAGRAIAHADAVSGVAFELWHEVVDGRFHGGCDQRLDLRRLCRNRGANQRRDKRKRAHEWSWSHSGSSPLALKIGFAAGAVSAWIKARAASGCLALDVMPAEYIMICCKTTSSMPITSTSGLDNSSVTCCRPISASPLATSTLTRPFGPPAESFDFGAISSAMPSFWKIF